MPEARYYWQNDRSYIDYKVHYYNPAYSFSVQITTSYDWYEEVTYNGLTFYVCRVGDCTTISFYANHNFYLIETNLGRAEWMELIQSLR